MTRNVLITVVMLYAALGVNAFAAPQIPVAETPEPSTFILVGGVGVIGFWMRHKRVRK